VQVEMGERGRINGEVRELKRLADIILSHCPHHRNTYSGSDNRVHGLVPSPA
jgi:hypothetical protein